MNSKRLAKILLCVVMMVCVALTIIACDTSETSLYYNDKVEGRYADGISIVSTSDAPVGASQFKDKARVEQVMYVDNTVKGLHFTGLYLPAGETMTVTISSETAQQMHKIVINSQQSDEIIVPLNTMRTQYKSAQGGRVDIRVDSAVVENQAFEIKISGCVSMPYYRLGVDKHHIATTGGGFATLDCANARFILPSELLGGGKELDKSLRWWRSAVEIMDRVTDLGFVSGDLSPIIIYVSDAYKHSTWNSTQKYIQLTTQDFQGILDYDNLVAGGGKKLLDWLGEMQAHRADGYGEGFINGNLGKILSHLTYIIMTDNVVNGESNSIANSASQLQDVLADTPSGNRQVLAFFDTILHSFGADKTIEVLKQYKYTAQKQNGVNNNIFDSYILDISNILESDLSHFCELLGIQLEDDTKTAMAEKPMYIPVQTKFTIGGSENLQTGVVCPMGQISEFDFENAIVSSMSGWSVDNIKGEGWQKVDTYKWNYTPSQDRLKDKFVVELSNGEHQVKLYGNILVDINVSSYSVYNDVSFRDVDSAIKGIKDKTPDHNSSLPFAQIAKEENEDESIYSFATSKGSLQVEESGKYTFYLKSKGLVKVKFGVSEYMFEMFNNILTVSDYTEELKCEVELDKDKIYAYEIYDLSTQGAGWAMLGIKTPSGTLVDLGQDYIVYSNMHRNQAVQYDSPVIDIEFFNIHQKDYDDYLTGKWVLKESPEPSQNTVAKNLFDNNNTTYFESKDSAKKFVFVVDMQSNFVVEYIFLGAKVDMVGVNVDLQVSDDNLEYKVVDQTQIENVENYIVLNKAVNTRYLKVTLTKEQDFVCSLSQIAMGKIMQESRIVPNTSTSISYQGEWENINKYSAINGCVTSNLDPNCAIEYDFYGSMISVYATTDRQFGVAKIYIDNKDPVIVDLNSPTAKCGQKVFYVDFGKVGAHTIKIVPVKDDKINIDYFTVISAPRPNAVKQEFNYWYIAIIPAVAVVGFVIALIADGVSKKRKTK